MAVAPASEIQVQKDVVYGQGSGHDLLCDVYRPRAATSKRTAVVHLHGGGFTRGNKAGVRLAGPLAERGYTCVSAGYRLVPEATWPAQIEDVRAALGWTRANAADLGVEPQRLVVAGYSAGARLALIAAGSDEMEVSACIAFYGPAGASANHPVLGPNPSDELRRSFMPLNYVRAGYPPTMLLHGIADQTIPVDASVQLFAALREVGAAVELHAIEGVTHIFDAHPDLAEASATWIDLFLDRHVVNPRSYPSTEPAPVR
jgi:acetyl esterase/lipase